MDSPPAQRPIVTLLSDFGLDDAYVGVIKGVILSIAPDAAIVDLSHAVPPQAVVQGAFLLDTAWRFFPPGTVHLAVVDPSVGSNRRRLAIGAGGQIFVGPDNGLLSSALPDAGRGRRGPGERYVPHRVLLPADVTAVSIENETVFRRPVSATFEGRDVFAPAAAFLARGGGLNALGPPIEALQAFAAFRAPAHDGGLDGLVLHVDRFGNLITDIRGDDLPATPVFVVAGHRLGLALTYAGADGPAAIVGSSGFVEIASPNGSAARELGAGAGDRVQVSSGPAN